MNLAPLSLELRKRFAATYQEELAAIVEARGPLESETDIANRSSDATSRATLRILQALEDRICLLEAQVAPPGLTLVLPAHTQPSEIHPT